MEGHVGAGTLLAAYSEGATGDEQSVVRPNPHAIEPGEWLVAYGLAQHVSRQWVDERVIAERERAGHATPGQRAARGQPGPGQRNWADPSGAEPTGAVRPVPPRAVSSNLEPEERGLIEAITKGEVRFEVRFPERGTRAFDANWKLSTQRRLRRPLRITIAAGMAFEWLPVNAVLVEDLVIEVPAGRVGEQGGELKLYLQEIPDRGQWDIAWSMIALHEPEGYMQDLLSVPGFLAANDRVRQAAIWISRVDNSKRVKKLQFTEYDYTFRNGRGVEQRPDPYDITRADWAAAERLAKTRNAGIRERRAVVAVERATAREAEAREIAARNEAEAAVKAARTAERDWLVARRALTIDSTLLRAVANGKLTVSIERLAVAPENTAVVLRPTAKLGEQWLDLRIAPGTVVRDVNDSSRVAYLPPARVLIGNPNSVTVPLRVVLGSLDGAGPGEFKLETPVVWLMGLLQQRTTVSTEELADHPERIKGRGWDADGVQGQLLLLVRQHPERTREDWAEQFAQRGLDDLFDVMGSAESLLGRYGGPTDRVASLRGQVELLDERAAKLWGPGGSAYTEADLVGTWRVASPSKGIELVLAHYERVLTVQWDSQFGGNPNRARLLREYRDNFRELTRRRHGYRHDMTLRADGTFEVHFDAYQTESNPIGRGRWLWSGQQLTLKSDGAQFRHTRRRLGEPWHPMWRPAPTMRIYEGHLMAPLDYEGEREMIHLREYFQSLKIGTNPRNYPAVMLTKRR